jgi:hypothetical protein
MRRRRTRTCSSRKTHDDSLPLAVPTADGKQQLDNIDLSKNSVKLGGNIVQPKLIVLLDNLQALAVVEGNETS